MHTPQENVGNTHRERTAHLIQASEPPTGRMTMYHIGDFYAGNFYLTDKYTGFAAVGQCTLVVDLASRLVVDILEV
jgi:hypothetical protein